MPNDPRCAVVNSLKEGKIYSSQSLDNALRPIIGSSTSNILKKSDFRTLGLATLGGALEFYDFIIFVFFANQIGQLFFPAEIPDWLRQFQTFGLFAVGYFVRPLSGIIMGHFGDLIGRKRIFTLSIFLMAVPTLAIGLLPSYSAIGIFAPIALLILRVSQGAAIG